MGLLAVALCVLPVGAANKTWDGGGGNNNWTTGANWDADTAPGANDSLFFAGTTDVVNTNTFAANTQFNGITFNSGAGAFVLSGNAINLGGDVVNGDNSLQTINLSLTLTASRNFNANSTGALGIGGVINGGGFNIIKGGTGTLQMMGNNLFNNVGLTMNSGVLLLTTANNQTRTFSLANLSGTGGTIQVNGNNSTVTLTVGSDNTSTSFSGGLTDQVSGNPQTEFSLTKTGTGTLTLNGANNYSGATAINAGAINIQTSSALGTTENGTTVASGAALELQNNITVGAEALGLNGTGILSGGALRNVSGNNTYGGAVALGSAARVNSDAGLLTLSGNFSGAFGLTVGGAGNTTISSAIGTGTGTLTKDGSGILTFSGASANTFSGTTTVNAGELDLNKTAGVNAIAGNLSVVGGTAKLLQNNQIANTASVAIGGGTFDLNGNSETINGLSGSGVVDNTFASAVTFTVGGNNASSTFSGTIQNTSGTLSLTKIGTGTLILGGANTYGGTTIVNAGTLIVNSTHVGAGGYTIANAGKLAGSGSIAGAITLNGTIAPGNSPDTLFTGSQTWNNGGSYEWEMNQFGGTPGADPGWDLTVITGSLDLTSLAANQFAIKLVSLTLANAAGPVVDFNDSSSYSLAIVTTTAGITGFDAGNFVVNTTDFQHLFTGTWSVALSGDNNSLLLNYTPFVEGAVPEPGTLGLLMIGGVLVITRRRRGGNK